MSIQTGYSTKPLPAAASELREQLGGTQPPLVFFFASDKYDAALVSRDMQLAFPAACVVGCSTAGEIATGQLLTGSIAAMVLDEDVVEDAVAVVLENLSEGVTIRDAFANFEQHFQAPATDWDLEKYVGLVLIDGLSGAEERLMEKLGDATDVLFVGGVPATI